VLSNTKKTLLVYGYTNQDIMSCELNDPNNNDSRQKYNLKIKTITSVDFIVNKYLMSKTKDALIIVLFNDYQGIL
jgi:2,3-bisphosphoglycerate-independent phosphoglycerate mutase